MIRKARADEAQAVTEVVVAAYRPYTAVIGAPPGPMLDDYAARIDARQAWVLEETNRLVGVLVLENRRDCFLLDNVAVRPDRQGTGLGSILLAFADAAALAHGWDAITLYTNALMHANVAIYGKQGYVERERRWEKGFHRVYMVKRLRRRIPGCGP